MIVFPEGTTSRGDGLLPFKASLLEVAARGGRIKPEQRPGRHHDFSPRGARRVHQVRPVEQRSHRQGNENAAI